MDETAPAPFLASAPSGFLQATEALTRLPLIELEILVVYVRVYVGGCLAGTGESDRLCACVVVCVRFI